MQNTTEILIELLKPVLKNEINTPISQSLTSLELVELIVTIEKKFKFEISPLEYDLKYFENISTIAKFVDSKIKPRE